MKYIFITILILCSGCISTSLKQLAWGVNKYEIENNQILHKEKVTPDEIKKLIGNSDALVRATGKIAEIMDPKMEYKELK